MSSSTLFGSQVSTPTAAASLLRAQASRLGQVLLAVEPLPLAAAVLAAEAWLEALGASSLSSTSHLGAAANDSLAAILRLAATGTLPEAQVHEEMADFDRFSALLARFDLWLSEWFYTLSDKKDAVLFAASCLSVGSDPKLSSLAELLEAWANEF